SRKSPPPRSLIQARSLRVARSRGPSERAVKTPSSTALSNAFDARKACASSMMRSGVTASFLIAILLLSASVVTPRSLGYDPCQFCSGSPGFNFVCKKYGKILRRSGSWLVAELHQARLHLRGG